MEGGRGRMPLRVLQRCWEDGKRAGAACKTSSQKPPKVAHEVRWSFIFMFLLSSLRWLNCVLTMSRRLLKCWSCFWNRILQRTLHVRRHNSFQRHCILAVTLFSLFEGGSLHFCSCVIGSLNLLLVLYSCCAWNTRTSLMLVTTGCFCERLPLCAPHLSVSSFSTITANFSVHSLICATVNTFVDMLLCSIVGWLIITCKSLF